VKKLLFAAAILIGAAGPAQADLTHRITSSVSLTVHHLQRFAHR